MFETVGKVPFFIFTIYFIFGLIALFGSIEWLLRVLVMIGIGFPALAFIASRFNFVRSFFWLVNTFVGWIRPTMIEVLEHILKNSKRGNVVDILRVWDEKCWSGHMMMNVGDVKGVIADAALEDAFNSWKVSAAAGATFTVVELGSHCGYSTLRFAYKLQQLLQSSSSSLKARVVSVDPDGLGAAISAKLVWYAGLEDLVEPRLEFSGDYFRQMAQEQNKIDYLFLDHVKELYLPDLKLAVQLNLLQPGSVVVADNVLFPGAPDYKQWLLEQEGKKIFETRVHDTFVEYSKTMPDQVLVSKKK